jgi:hypothetical protein
MAGAAVQRCRVHFLRNVLAQVPKGSAEMVAAAIRTISPSLMPPTSMSSSMSDYLLVDLRPPAHRARTGRAGIGGTHSLPGSECDTAPMMAPSQVLAGVRRRIERAVADGAPEQLKCLLDSVVEQIVVEYRACIQPYFVAPTVRTRIRPRRRTGIEPA